jgi:hypothetical protein
MKKLTIVTLAIMLCACSAATDPQQENDLSKTSPQPGISNGQDTPRGTAQCTTLAALTTETGEVVLVPVACGNGSIDHGDPPPEAQKKWAVDPSPEQHALREQVKN